MDQLKNFPFLANALGQSDGGMFLASSTNITGNGQSKGNDGYPPSFEYFKELYASTYLFYLTKGY